MADHSRITLLTTVGRALSRKRQPINLATRVTWAGLEFSLEMNGLLVLEKNGETLARGVFQAGQLVYLTAQGKENLEAIAALSGIQLDVLYYPLEIPAQTLLCAVAAGEAVEIGVSKVLTNGSLVEELQLFDGALLLELGIQAIAVRMQRQQLSFSENLSAAPMRYRYTKIKWLETNLPALTATNARDVPLSSGRMVLMLDQFEVLIRSYLGQEASAVMQAIRQELLLLTEQQALERLKAQLQRIGPSVVLDFETRIKR